VNQTRAELLSAATAVSGQRVLLNIVED